MKTLVAFHKVGNNRNTPRVWLESSRLTASGFSSGAPFSVIPTARGVSLRLSDTGSRVVSSRRAAGGIRPIIDLCSRDLLRLDGVSTIKASASFGTIDIVPSVRAFLVAKRLRHEGPFRALEVFAGGGTLSSGLQGNPHINVVAGVEIEPSFADVWGNRHPNATLFQSDIRLVHPSELPKFDILIGGIPCTSHSTMGRAKKGLAGRPEEGDTGDLFLHVLQIAAHHMPAACVFENVPNFGDSAAGYLIKTTLKHLGYHITETIIEPHAQWNEASDRRRWALVATLSEGFSLTSPMTQRVATVNDLLDPENDDADRIDADRISVTIAGLRRHNARHAALGHGFAFTTINRSSVKVPTIPKSYHKINTGPFVETPYGPRLLRLHEIEAIMGATAGTSHYSTGVQILGQGVQTRIWRNILGQVGEFLARGEGAHAVISQPVGQLALF